MSKTELQEEWERRVDIFLESGQTQTKWCEDNDLGVHQLKYWLKKLGKSKPRSQSTTQWLPVALEKPTQDNNETLLIKIGETSIEVKPGFNSTFLADVVRTLTSL